MSDNLTIHDCAKIARNVFRTIGRNKLNFVSFSRKGHSGENGETRVSHILKFWDDEYFTCEFIACDGVKSDYNINNISILVFNDWFIDEATLDSAKLTFAGMLEVFRRTPEIRFEFLGNYHALSSLPEGTTFKSFPEILHCVADDLDNRSIEKQEYYKQTFELENWCIYVSDILE